MHPRPPQAEETAAEHRVPRSFPDGEGHIRQFYLDAAGTAADVLPAVKAAGTGGRDQTAGLDLLAGYAVLRIVLPILKMLSQRTAEDLLPQFGHIPPGGRTHQKDVQHHAGTCQKIEHATYAYQKNQCAGRQQQ